MTIRLPISESFISLQGEGLLAGMPSYFIRLSGCNLRCTWCDTPHASWNPDGELHTLDAIIAAVSHAVASRNSASARVQHVVITGGEPFIFAHLPQLCDALRAMNLHITIETAGTVFTKVDAQLLSISPKLRNSTPKNDPRDATGEWAQRHEERRLNFDALAALVRTAPEYQLKFVVSSPADIEEIEDVLAQLNATLAEHAAALAQPALTINRTRVLLMPEGTAPVAPGQRDWLVQLCIHRGFRYCHRVHVDLFGHKRGT